MHSFLVSRLGRPGSGSPDSMSSSYHGNTSSSMNNDSNALIQMSTSLIENVNNEQNNIMVQSLDPTILSSPSTRILEPTIVRSVIPQLNDQQARQSSPLVAATKMVPVPETLMSPDCPPPTGVTTVHQRAVNSHNIATPNNKVASKLTSNKGDNYYSFLFLIQ